MLNTGNHFRVASEALAHCYADLLEGRTLTSEEHSAAMRIFRMATSMIGLADPAAQFDWERLKIYLSGRAESHLLTESEMPVNTLLAADESISVDVIRDGALVSIPFSQLRAGDATCSPGVPRIVVGEDAHKSEDPEYTGWLVYDIDENSYFPEDFSGCRPVT